MNYNFVILSLFFTHGLILSSSQEPPNSQSLQRTLQENPAWIISVHKSLLGKKSIEVKSTSAPSTTLYPLCSEENALNIMESLPVIRTAPRAFPECFVDILTGNNTGEALINTPTSLTIADAHKIGLGTVYAQNLKNTK